MRRTATLLSMTLALACLASACLGSADGDAEKLALQRGIEAFERKDYKTASEHFTRAIEAEPDNAEAYYWRARSEFLPANPTDWKRGSQDIERALTLNPELGDAYRLRGQHYAARRVYYAALGDFEKAAQFGVGTTTVYNNLSACCFAVGRLDDAITAASEAIRLDANDAFAYRNRGQAYQEKGDLSRALADLSRSLELAPNASIARFRRSQIYFTFHRIHEALEDANEAIRLDPAWPVAFAHRSQILSSMERHREAIADMDAAIELEPDEPKWRWLRGEYYFNAGERERAISEFEAMFRRHPSLERRLQLRATFHVFKEERHQAIACYEEHVQSAPDDLGTRLRLALLYVQVSQPEKALHHLDAAIKLDDQDFNVYLQRAQVYCWGLDQLLRGIADYDKAIELRPDLAVIYRERGSAFLKMGNYRKALSDFDKSLTLNPQGDTVTFAHRSEALRKLHQLDKALNEANLAVMRTPDKVAPYLERSSVYTMLDQNSDAVADLDIAIRLDAILNDRIAIAWARGMAQLKLGYHEDALSDFETAIHLDPKLKMPACGPACLHLARGEPQEAITVLKATLAMTPNDAETHLLAGRICFDLKDARAAMHHFNEAIRIEGRDPSGYYLRGRLLHEQLKRPDEALADFDRAVKLCPVFARAFQARGKVYLEQGKLDQSLADANEAIRLTPHHAPAFELRSRTLDKLGRHEDAQADAARARELAEIESQRTGQQAGQEELARQAERTEQLSQPQQPKSPPSEQQPAPQRRVYNPLLP